MKTYQNNSEPFNLDQLVEGLKKEDARNLKMTHNFKWLMWFLTPLYIVIFIIGNLVDPEPRSSLGLLFFALGFFFFAFLFKNLNKVYKSVDYGLPTTEMLRKAAQRYELWQSKTYFISIPVLLFCIGFGFSAEKGMPETAFLSRFALAFLLILVIFVISFFVGYLIWRKRQKPLRDQALALLSELKN